MPAKIEREGVISVFDFFKMFPDEDSAREYIGKIRWEDDVYCPHCGCDILKKFKRVPKRRRVTKLKRKGYYFCRWCEQKFTVRTGTVFQRSHIPLNKWLYAIFMLETARKVWLVPIVRPRNGKNTVHPNDRELPSYFTATPGPPNRLYFA